MRHLTFLILLLTILLLNSRESFGRRGRSRARSKSRVQIGLPITGKYRDTESDQYYNNDNGAKILLASHFDFEYVLGHKIAFVCVARDKVKSKLEIDPATQMDAGVYECTADNMYSIDRRSFKTDFSIAFD
ncbi:hypothetical protein M0804_006949 [Polistes exclamans]|nr:hypothetical protein M0804_006949 [Polistes exclamans]